MKLQNYEIYFYLEFFAKSKKQTNKKYRFTKKNKLIFVQFVIQFLLQKSYAKNNF